MVTVANTKMMVRPASRMLSAISFGVFCRSAPSTSLIMRSMKVDPCAAVMRTRIQSDKTCVPPVTAERSPPDSRITGADSPVIAASLTEAMPSMTSPSEGIKSRASTSTKSRIRMIVVSAVTTSSTNITGFLIKVRGSSLTNAEPIAGMTIFESSSADTGTCFRGVELSITIAPNLIRRERRTGIDRELLDDRAKRERWEKGKAADNDDHTHQEADEEPTRGREGAGGRWY